MSNGSAIRVATAVSGLLLAYGTWLSVAHADTASCRTWQHCDWNPVTQKWACYGFCPSVTCDDLSACTNFAGPLGGFKCHCGTGAEPICNGEYVNPGDGSVGGLNCPDDCPSPTVCFPSNWTPDETGQKRTCECL